MYRKTECQLCNVFTFTIQKLLQCFNLSAKECKNYYAHELKNIKKNTKKQWELLDSFFNKDVCNIPVTKVCFNRGIRLILQILSVIIVIR